ncbi:hypothetical protein [Clostridium estertheticum]|uniref:hypothetical protein n=1 Tax=Clostridium estertheticum TaxID=238834 RepID=UPI001C0E1C48|nr:hypothetical protein [Clostridium estertheticum]MBU3173350.1 hypothetical protein [Clostridium estertheticum]
MNNSNNLENKQLREMIESIIQRKAVNGNFVAAHEAMYNTFFSIFKDLKNEYTKRNKVKRINKIDFIEEKNMLYKYYQVVSGNENKVRKSYRAKIREENEIAEKRCYEKLEIDRQEVILEKRAELWDKIQKGQITVADNLALHYNGYSKYCISVKNDNIK